MKPTSPAFTPDRIHFAEIDLGSDATSLARLMVERSEDGLDNDPSLSLDEIMTTLSLSAHQATRCVEELEDQAYVYRRDRPGGYSAGARKLIFATFDGYWQPWRPRDDALLLAQRLSKLRDEQTLHIPELAAELSWSSRRMNPALTVLEMNDAATLDLTTIPSWAYYRIQCCRGTDRFINSITR